MGIICQKKYISQSATIKKETNNLIIKDVISAHIDEKEEEISLNESLSNSNKSKNTLSPFIDDPHQDFDSNKSLEIKKKNISLSLNTSKKKIFSSNDKLLFTKDDNDNDLNQNYSKSNCFLIDKKIINEKEIKVKVRRHKSLEIIKIKNNEKNTNLLAKKLDMTDFEKQTLNKNSNKK